jgi:hypothetical protein
MPPLDAAAEKAICRPSGAHWGIVTSGPPKDVSGTMFDPSASHTQISLLPERFDANAMRLPCGEYCAILSKRWAERKKIPYPLEMGLSLKAAILAPPIASRILHVNTFLALDSAYPAPNVCQLRRSVAEKWA